MKINDPIQTTLCYYFETFDQKYYGLIGQNIFFVYLTVLAPWFQMPSYIHAHNPRPQLGFVGSI